MSNQELNAVVATKEELSSRLMILRVVADGWQLPDFKTGQYVALGLPGSAPRCQLSVVEPAPADPHKLIRRAYSIASSSLTREYMDFCISLVTSGSLTPRLFALKIGDRLSLSSKITGMFTLDQVPEGKHVVMIATDMGLAPYMSTLSTHLQCDSSRQVAVLHGAYHSWDLGYRSELLTLQHLCSNLTYFAIIDSPENEPVPWSGPTGFVQELWLNGYISRAWGFEPTPDNTDIFLCGNPNMIEDMKGLLSQAGFREHTPHDETGQIHIERF